MKTKNILLIIIIILLAIIFAGMYKFNYLSNKNNRNVDANKYIQETHKRSDDLCDENGNRYKDEEEARNAGLNDAEFGATYCPEYKMHPSWDKNNDGINDCYDDDSCSSDKDYMSQRQDDYLARRLDEVKNLGFSVEKTQDENGRTIFETVTKEWTPFKEISIHAREFWHGDFVGKTMKEILSEYQGIIETDFENTGDMKIQLDTDIFLNNIITRLEIEPKNEDHIELLIEDLRLDDTVADENSVSNSENGLTILHIPNLEFDESTGIEKVVYDKYRVPYTKSVLNETYKRLFEINSYNNDGVWNGLKFNSVSIEDSVAKIKLNGSWRPVGDMSSYYFSLLVDAAAFQYNSVDKVEVYMNNALFDWCIDDLSDGESGCPDNHKWWSITKSEYNEGSLWGNDL